VSSRAFAELRGVSDFLEAPVATTINGKGAVSETHALSIGTVGANAGRPYAAQVLGEADLVLFIGSKVNYVDTDSWRYPSLAEPPTILQIDVDPAEIGNNYAVDEGLCGDAKMALADLLQALEVEGSAPPDRGRWLAQIAAYRAAWQSSTRELAKSSEMPIMPRRVIGELESILPEEAVLVCDPGTPTPFVAAELELRQPGRRVVIPRAQGGLGYAIPGVVGARMARPDQPVVGLCGDGSFAMSAGDLATVARVAGPTVLILFNNGCYGWIKALQELYHGGRYFSVDFEEEMSYTDVARGFGLHAKQVRDPEEIGPVLKEALGSGSPSLIELLVAPEHEAATPVAPWQRAEAVRRAKAMAG
jgi:acetolactate synthase-1/2/3 large subunit